MCPSRPPSPGCLLGVGDVQHGVVERACAGVGQAVFPLALAVDRVVGAEGAGLRLLQAHQLHGPVAVARAERQRGVALPARVARRWGEGGSQGRP